MFRICLAAALILTITTGCGKPPPALRPAPPTIRPPVAANEATIPGPPGTQVAQGAPAAKAPGASPTLVGMEVTSGEYFDAAKAIEAAAKDDATKFAAYFDLDALAETAIKGIDLGAQFRKGFKSGFTNQPAQTSMAGQIAAAVQMGGGYTLLRVHRHGDQHAAIFRLQTGAGLNYHDLHFTKGTDGKIKVTDFYVLLTGELMSTTIRQMVLPIAANQNRNLLDKLTKKESDYVTHFPKIQEISTATRARDFAKVMEIYRSMPQSLQESKIVLIARLNAASQSQNWDETRAATADFRRLYPGDSTADLLGLDALILEKKYDEALAAVDRIDKLVGGDPHLETLRTNIREMKKMPQPGEF